MLHLQIDPRSAVPVYRQMMDQVKYYIASGVLKPGDRLPSIRECARYLGVNPTTVVKAYTELEHEGVITRKHGKGAFVADRQPDIQPEALEATLRELVRHLCVEAAQMGAPMALVLKLVKEEMGSLSSERGES